MVQARPPGMVPSTKNKYILYCSIQPNDKVEYSAVSLNCLFLTVNSNGVALYFKPQLGLTDQINVVNNEQLSD